MKPNLERSCRGLIHRPPTGLLSRRGTRTGELNCPLLLLDPTFTLSQHHLSLKRSAMAAAPRVALPQT